jgi:hypothetical protein
MKFQDKISMEKHINPWKYSGKTYPNRVNFRYKEIDVHLKKSSTFDAIVYL